MAFVLWLFEWRNYIIRVVCQEMFLYLWELFNLIYLFLNLIYDISLGGIHNTAIRHSNTLLYGIFTTILVRRRNWKFLELIHLLCSLIILLRVYFQNFQFDTDMFYLSKRIIVMVLR